MDLRQPFGEHLRELRSRLIFSLSALGVGAAAGFILHNQLLKAVSRPLHQKLYYTSPLAGFNAIVKISLIFGLILALPVCIYQLSRFLSPAMPRSYSHKKSMWFMVISAVLAAAGVGFGYFICLPAALHFLTHVGGTNLQPIFIVNDYLNFVFTYLVVFALIFQLPIIFSFINRIKPQNPRKLLVKYQRWVIAGSFILAAIVTPTPDPFNQLVVAMPIIALYEVSVLCIWLQNRRAEEGPLGYESQASPFGGLPLGQQLGQPVFLIEDIKPQL